MVNEAGEGSASRSVIRLTSLITGARVLKIAHNATPCVVGKIEGQNEEIR